MKDENKKTEQDKKIVEFDIDEAILEDSELDRFLRKSMQDAADALEERLNNDPRLQGIDAPEGMFASIVRELKRQGLWQEEISDDTGKGHIHSGFGMISDNFYSRDGTNHGNIYSETGRVGGTIFTERGSISAQVGTCNGSIYTEIGIVESLANDDNKKVGKEVKRAKQKTACAVLDQNDKQALQLGSDVAEDREAWVLKRKKRTRLIRYSGVAAAVMVLFLGFSETGEAGKSLVLKAWNNITENMGFRIATNSVGGDAHEKLKEDMVAMQEISERIGISAIDFVYLPEELKYEHYEIMEEVPQATVFYGAEEKSLIVTMLSAENEAASYYSVDSGAILQETVKNDQNIVVEIRKINLNEAEETYVAEFRFKDCRYLLNGRMSFAQMKKIVKSMFVL